MNTTIETIIKRLAEKINDKTSPDEALKFTQAALNLAHTLAVLGSRKI